MSNGKDSKKAVEEKKPEGKALPFKKESAIPPIKLTDKEYKKLKEMTDRKQMIAARAFEMRVAYLNAEGEMRQQLGNLAIDIQKEVEYIGRDHNASLKKIKMFKVDDKTKELIIF